MMKRRKKKIEREIEERQKGLIWEESVKKEETIAWRIMGECIDEERQKKETERKKNGRKKERKEEWKKKRDKEKRVKEWEMAL